jgi:hypothetical protein
MSVSEYSSARGRERRVNVNHTMQGFKCATASLHWLRKLKLRSQVSLSLRRKAELRAKSLGARIHNLLWKFFQSRVPGSHPTIKGRWVVAKERMSFALAISQSCWERIQFKLHQGQRNLRTQGRWEDQPDNLLIFQSISLGSTRPNNIFKQSSESIIGTFIEINLYSIDGHVWKLKENKIIDIIRGSKREKMRVWVKLVTEIFGLFVFSLQSISLQTGREVWQAHTSRSLPTSRLKIGRKSKPDEIKKIES